MTKWHDYIVFTKAYPFIIGLIFSQTLADNTLVIVLITYLKQEWNQNLRVAAAIVNFREFITDILKVFVSHFSDEYFGRFAAVLWLTASYTFGLLMLWVLEAHNSNNVKMLYMALFFISLGKAGDVSFKSFISDQLRVKEPSEKVDDDLVEGRTKVWRGFPWFLAAIIASFLNASWDAYSILLTIVLAAELLGFWSGMPLYAYEINQTESAWKKIYHVGKAAILKRHLPYPNSAGEFYKNTKGHKQIRPNNFFFRWLDKAARIDHMTTLSVQEQVDVKMLFTVVEVEEVKYLSKIFPTFPTLLIYSIVEAAGTTLFINQANEIDSNFPAIRLYIIRNITSYCASTLWSNRREKLLKLKILTGMVCSVLCTIIAWRVEVYRKHVLEHDYVTISIWYLTPQFIFLGLMEGLLKDGIEGIFKDKVSKSMGISGTNLVQFMIGIGRLLSFLFVLILGSGFNERNRMGSYYYRLLGATSVVNASISGPILNKYLKDAPITLSATTLPSTPTSSNPMTPPPGSPGPSPVEENPETSPPGPPGAPTQEENPKTSPPPCPPTTDCDNSCHRGCIGFCNGGTTHDIYPDYCNGDFWPFSDGIQNPQPVLDCQPWIPEWSCNSTIEGTSSNFPTCTCGCNGHNNSPVICTPWIVLHDGTQHTGGDTSHNCAL